MLESLRGLRDTLQYQDTAARAAGITAHSETLGEKQKALKYREGLTVAITNTLILFTVIAVLGVSLQLYRNGQMGVEGVLICTLSALSSFGPVVALANLGASLTQVFASADRVLDLLDEEPVTADVTDGAHTAFAGAQAEHVSFAYADEEVLHDLSLTIPEKKIVGITGRSGSGKSTLLNIIGLILKPDSGSVAVGGGEVLNMSDRRCSAFRNASFGYIAQDFALLDDETVYHNIRIPLLYNRQIKRREHKPRIREIAQKLDISDKLNRKAGKLSGGERQRVAIARAIVCDQPIILADEPTGSLDAANKANVMDILMRLCKESGKTLIIVTHDPSIAERCDRIVQMTDGRIEGNGKNLP